MSARNRVYFWRVTLFVAGMCERASICGRNYFCQQLSKHSSAFSVEHRIHCCRQLDGRPLRIQAATASE